MRPDGFVALGRERAKPLAPDERRAAIIDAVIPLIRENGRDISTREIAESAGVAEGTIFRAFGDKDSIIQAAIDRYLDPTPLRNALRGIDPDEPTEDKVRQVIELLRERFTGVIGFMHALGHARPAARARPLRAGVRMDRDGRAHVPPRRTRRPRRDLRLLRAAAWRSDRRSRC